MCNRYSLSVPAASLFPRYNAKEAANPVALPTPELFPRKPAYVIRNADGVRTLDVMAWGFPMMTKGKSGKDVRKDVTNVRNYTSPFWRSTLANPLRRCLVPFSAFSEYGQIRGDDGKLPLHWFDVPSQPITSFAGIWRPTDEGAVFAFLTTEPNAIVAPIHPKAMPVLLHPEDEERWLTAPMEDALSLAEPFPTQLMRALS
ncbi:SOS response-associated peptidase [Sphingomonas sp. SAFR-052]|uniref:SOS response-associated peptidase n=1 Tax=Sphingomonas sp. SAFR-052 TaxID=3436867 RepID=UPI003F81EA2E